MTHHHGVIRLTRSGMFLVLAALQVGGVAIWTLRQNNLASTGSNLRAAAIEDILSNPKAYAGQRVQLSGRLDECFGWECSLCPEQKTDRSVPGRCLALEFRPLVDGTGFGETEQEVKAAALRAGYSDRKNIKVFYSAPRLIVCETLYGSDAAAPGVWPRSVESALYARSTLDFFHCNEVRKIDGKMVVQV